MAKKIFIAIGIFLLVMLALTYGADVLQGFKDWFERNTGLIINNIHDVFRYVWFYFSNNWFKVILALILTALICAWLFAGRATATDSTSGKPRAATDNRKKIAIILAVFLGWAGIHRFYLNQFWTGLLYLIIGLLFTPLGVLLGLIDAVRYYTTNDEEFLVKYKL